MNSVRMISSLTRRELLRFARQPARIAASIGTPLLIWIFLASGFANIFRDGEAGLDYAGYLLPGMMTLVVMFTAIFSSISVIEDRQSGFLAAALVAPAPRWAIALGNMLGGGMLAWAQSAVLLGLIFMPTIQLQPRLLSVVVTLLLLAVVSFGLTAFGLIFAWRSETTAGFHSVMNLVLMPMWLLSGALFPPEGAAGWLATLMWINPLTWCNETIRSGLTGDVLLWPLLGTLTFVVSAFGAAVWVVSWPGKRPG